jgi:hypothetical protein
MRRLLLVVGIGLMATALATPATADWNDDFEAYEVGSSMHGQGGWKGWGNDPTYTAYVTDLYSHSPTKSVDIQGLSDLVHEYSGYTSGKWIYTAWQYVPTDFTGLSYFILLNTYSDPGTNNNWSTQISFGDGLVTSEFEYVTLDLITGRWVELKVEIDLDANVQTVYYDGQVLTTKSWTEGVSGGGARNIGAVDLFANGASSVYYDDISLVAWCDPSATEATTWSQLKAVFR